ncbi:MAG: hypothetical protein IPK01_01075 [Acidobacteria bacterium]|nr:hypothetical protein [Acidobacteriota bacterium]
MDCDLDEVRSEGIRAHLAICEDCSAVCEDIASLVDVCRTESPNEILPPNSQALWCRINNIIESEVAPEKVVPPEPRKRFWQLSFPQLASALAGIALVSSLLTVVVIRQYTQPTAEDFTTRNPATLTTFEKVLGKVGLISTPQQAREKRVREQQAAIDYWNSRVQARRVQWDRNTREAFDRNLKVIDQSLNEYTVILEQDPEDDLSSEMLDSVLNDKMNLLRDFSDL